MKMSSKECDLNELCKFLLSHVAVRDDVRRIERILKVNKGASYFPNMMTLEHVSYVVRIMENHFDQWKHKLWLWIETLGEDERLKARDYKKLPQGERSKYAPNKTRYTSGEGSKREHGKSLVSDKSKKRSDEIKNNWKIVWEDESIRTALTKEWKKIAGKYNRCQGYERTENTGGEEVAVGGGEGEGEEELVPEIDLHGVICNDVPLVVPV